MFVQKGCGTVMFEIAGYRCRFEVTCHGKRDYDEARGEYSICVVVIL